MTTWLVDTGPFVAYINRTDPMHEPVAVCVDGFAGQLVTTGAVVTEVMYFLSGVSKGPGAFAELLLAGGVRQERDGLQRPGEFEDLIVPASRPSW